MNPSNRNPVLKFDLNDFRTQIVQMKKMGSVKDLMGKLPGMSQMASSLDRLDADAEVKRIQGIIDGMTAQERMNPNLIDLSRRRRIAVGAGVDPADVSSLVKQFVIGPVGSGPWPGWAGPGETGDRDDDGASPVRR